MEEKSVKNNNGKGKTIILIVIAVVVLLVVGYFICSKVLAKNTNKKKKNNNVANSVIVNQEPDDSDLILKIYEQTNTNKYTITKSGYNNEEYKYLASYSCSNLNCKGYSVTPVGTKSIIYDNYKYYLYNYGNARLEELDLGTGDIENIEMIYSNTNVYGLYVINSESKGAFYNLDKKRYVTEFVYDGDASSKAVNLIDNNYFVGVSNLDDSNVMLYVIDSEAGDIVKTMENVTDIDEELKSLSLR